MRKKYKKDIQIEYAYYKSIDNEKILENVFDKLFSKIIQDRKRLLAFLRSDEFKETRKKLEKRKSVLVDYISFH